MSRTASPLRSKRPPLWQVVLALVLVSWVAFLVVGMPLVSVKPAPSAAPKAIASHEMVLHLQALDRLVPHQSLQVPQDPRAITPRPVRWVDTSGKSDLDEARARLLAGAFTPVTVPQVDGFTRDAHWYAMHWRRIDAEQGRWLLTVGQPFLDDVQVYIERSQGTVQRYQMGDHHLAQGRPVNARWHVVGVNLAPQEDVVVWVRVASGGLLNVAMSIDTPGNYFFNEVRNSALLGVSMGILLLAVFTYLSVGMWLRDGLLLAYAALLASLSMLYMARSGLLIQLTGTPPWWLSDLFAGVGSLGPWFAGNLMWAQALGLAMHSPRMHKVYVGTALLFLLSSPLVLTPFYGALSQLSYVLGLCMSPLFLGLTWQAWRRDRDHLSVTYLLAVAVFQTGLYINILYLLGVLPRNAFTLEAASVSTALHTLIMGVALAMRIERIRRGKIEAEQRAEAHRRFVALLTHEFRNPLSSIDRSANLIQAMRDRRNGPEQARVANIRQQARRLNTLVDSFLLVPDDGALPTQPQKTPVQLNPWLESLCQSLGAELAARVELELPQPQDEAMLDPRLMQLALNNLLDNALRYSPDGAKVQLHARLVSRGGCEISVIDRGLGLDDAALGRLGRPYHRGDNASGTQGTGLGYYFCKQIVEAHGGSIQATRAQPRGLCVTLRLP